MRIENLAAYPIHIPLVASWQQVEFGYLNSSVGLEERTEKLRQSVLSPMLPITLLALSDDGEPVGAASILESTLTHRHLTPWLSTVVVPPNHRNKGIASALSECALLTARAMDFDKLYLFTPTNESLYARLGWTKFETTEFKGIEMSLMERSTRAPKPPFERAAVGAAEHSLSRT